jgi:hypothetical protein
MPYASEQAALELCTDALYELARRMVKSNGNVKRHPDSQLNNRQQDRCWLVQFDQGVELAFIMKL